MAFADAVVLTPVTLTKLSAVVVSAALSAADGTNGNKFLANAGTILRVKNLSEAQITVTVHTNLVRAGLTLPDKTFTVAAATGIPLVAVDALFQFDDLPAFYQNDLKQVWVTFSAVTDVSVKVYQV